MTKRNDPKTKELAQALLALKNAKEVEKFLGDLLTEAEILEFGKRWQAAQMLDQKVSYSQIIKKTGLSSTTVARISKWLKNGKGGYRLILDRLGRETLDFDKNPPKSDNKVDSHHHGFSSIEKGL